MKQDKISVVSDRNHSCIRSRDSLLFGTVCSDESLIARSGAWIGKVSFDSCGACLRWSLSCTFSVMKSCTFGALQSYISHWLMAFPDALSSMPKSFTSGREKQSNDVIAWSVSASFIWKNLTHMHCFISGTLVFLYFYTICWKHICGLKQTRAVCLFVCRADVSVCGEDWNLFCRLWQKVTWAKWPGFRAELSSHRVWSDLVIGKSHIRSQ